METVYPTVTEYLQALEESATKELAFSKFIKDNEQRVLSTDPSRKHKITPEIVRRHWRRQFNDNLSGTHLKAIDDSDAIPWVKLTSLIIQRRGVELMTAKRKELHTSLHEQENDDMCEALRSVAKRKAPESVNESASLPSKSSARTSNHDDMCREEFDRKWSHKNTHYLNLYNHNIVQCGIGIRRRKEIPVELYELTGEDQPEVDIQEYHTYINEIIQTLDYNIIFHSTHRPNRGDPRGQLIEDILWPFIKKIIPNNGDGCERYESNLNHRCVWPCLEAVVESVDGNTLGGAHFDDGERLLKSMTSGREGKKIDYKADGIGFLRTNNIEFLLLETSGPYGTNDKTRHTYDHIKGTFGVLSMLHRLLRLYPWADINLLPHIKVFFVHCRGQQLHLWSLGINTEDENHHFYEMKRRYKATIPVTVLGSPKLLEIIRFMFRLQVMKVKDTMINQSQKSLSKDLVQNAIHTYSQLKVSHEEYIATADTLAGNERQRIDAFISSIPPLLNKRKNYKCITQLHPASYASK